MTPRARDPRMIGVTDLARELGVTAVTVLNWRRRYDDTPAPDSEVNGRSPRWRNAQPWREWLSDHPTLGYRRGAATRQAEGYQGWENYETWAVKLWLDNEEGTYLDVTGHAMRAVHWPGWQEGDYSSLRIFSEWLKGYVEALITGYAPGFYGDNYGDGVWGHGLASDLFNSAWSAVNWDEIAGAYLRDAREEMTRA